MAIEFNEHIAILQNLQKLDHEATGVLLNVGGELLAKIKNRIAVDGKNSNGGQIGSYSTKEMYATIDQFDKKSAFKPSTKNSGETITYDIKKRKKLRTVVTSDFRVPKTMHLPEGYKQLRDIQGKPTGFVNLVYRSDLMAAFQMIRDGNAVVIGFRTERESLKRKGLEKKYKQVIFSGSAEELQTASEDFVEQFTEVALKFYKGVKE